MVSVLFSLASNDSGDYLCFWKPGDADLLQMIPPIVLFLLYLLPTDPTFIHVHLIPDSAERNDDKLYFFFREKSSEMGQSPVTQSRIGRICLVCKHMEACLFCSENSLKRKLVLFREKRRRGFGGGCPAVFDCLGARELVFSQGWRAGIHMCPKPSCLQCVPLSVRLTFDLGLHGFLTSAPRQSQNTWSL